jgi:hypothetical protein
MSRLTPVFISHASDDREPVQRLADALRQHGIQPVLYDEHLPLGASIIGWIDAALSTCRYSLIVASDAYFAKQWTSIEYRAILHKHIADPDKPFIVASVLPTVALPPLLQTFRFIVLTDPERAAADIAEAVSRFEAGTPDAPHPPVDRPIDPVDFGSFNDREIVAIAEALIERWFELRRTPGPVAALPVQLGRRRISLSVHTPGLKDDFLKMEIQHQIEMTRLHIQFMNKLRQSMARGGLGIFGPAFEIEMDRQREDYATALDALRKCVREMAEARIEG